MSYEVVKEVRDLLISDGTVISLVPASNIRVGWSESRISFPIVVITMVSESDIGYLGFGTSSEGNKLHRQEATIQVDILSRSSIKETLDIGDAITKVLMYNGFSKATEVDIWDNLLKAHRRMLRFRKTYIKSL